MYVCMYICWLPKGLIYVDSLIAATYMQTCMPERSGSACVPVCCVCYQLCVSAHLPILENTYTPVTIDRVAASECQEVMQSWVLI